MSAFRKGGAMPHKALNRVVVRMLFDPDFQRKVYQNPQETMGPLGIPSSLQNELIKNDPRAWNIDTQRRKRTLHALMGEFPCACALALAHTKKLGQLDAFLSSIEFHDSVQKRGSMTLAFVDFLRRLHQEERIDEAQFLDVLMVEVQKAICRRNLEQGSMQLAPHEIIRHPGVCTSALNSTVIESMNVIEEYLYELSLIPAIALCEDKPGFPELPTPENQGNFFLLFRPRDEEIAITPVSVVIHDALSELEKPLSRDMFFEKMKKRGLASKSCEQLLESLIQEKLVTHSS